MVGSDSANELDDIVEHLAEEARETGQAMTRFKIGTTLKDFGMNSAENMKESIKRLVALGVTIA